MLNSVKHLLFPSEGDSSAFGLRMTNYPAC